MIHVVQPGQTLTRIALSYGVSPRLLELQNGLANPDQLVPGQALLVLIPQLTYTVTGEENLADVALATGQTIRQLHRNSPWLEGREELGPGDLVVIAYTEEAGIARLFNGYTYPFINMDTLETVLPYLSALLPFTYGFTENGDLVPLDDQELLDRTFAANTQALMVIAPLGPDDMFSNQLISQVLNNDQARGNLISQIVMTVEQKGYSGVDLDFEYVLAGDAAAYVGFAAELADVLHKSGNLLTVTLAPKTYAEQEGELYEGHDYQLLGEVADFVLLMTYEWGYTYGPPMAVSPIYEVQKVVSYALTEIPAEKILLGMPNYGYDWTLPYEHGHAARSISNPEAMRLAWEHGASIQYDEAAQTPHFNYTTAEGVQHEVWFEDVRSMSAKFDLIDNEALAGGGFWTIVRPFVANWLLLSSRYQFKPLPEVRP